MDDDWDYAEAQEKEAMAFEKLMAERDAALARAERAEAALAPFAGEYECWPEEWPDNADNMEFACIQLTKGDFAKAAKVIKEAKP